METVVIVAGVKGKVFKTNADYIGVDEGCLFCVNENITPVIGIGDFDSCDDKQFTFPILKYNKEKDETDLELALLYAKDRYQKIYVSNAIGKRSDHFLYNLKLLKKHDAITLISEYEKIYILNAGKHQVLKQYRYFSFFALEETKISLTGFKYPFKESVYNIDDLQTISNECIEDVCEIEILYGKILCIECFERREE